MSQQTLALSIFLFTIFGIFRSAMICFSQGHEPALWIEDLHFQAVSPLAPILHIFIFHSWLSYQRIHQQSSCILISKKPSVLAETSAFLRGKLKMERKLYQNAQRERKQNSKSERYSARKSIESSIHQIRVNFKAKRHEQMIFTRQNIKLNFGKMLDHPQVHEQDFSIIILYLACTKCLSHRFSKTCRITASSMNNITQLSKKSFVLSQIQNSSILSDLEGLLARSSPFLNFKKNSTSNVQVQRFPSRAMKQLTLNMRSTSRRLIGKLMVKQSSKGYSQHLTCRSDLC